MNETTTTAIRPLDLDTLAPCPHNNGTGERRDLGTVEVITWVCDDCGARTGETIAHYFYEADRRPLRRTPDDMHLTPHEERHGF
jgi:hypothetical protein